MSPGSRDDISGCLMTFVRPASRSRAASSKRAVEAAVLAGAGHARISSHRTGRCRPSTPITALAYAISTYDGS